MFINRAAICFIIFNQVSAKFYFMDTLKIDFQLINL